MKTRRILPLAPTGPLHTEKPNKGRIKDWTVQSSWDNEGRPCKYIVGLFLDHPQYKGRRGHTSIIVKKTGYEIETLNSRYTLVGEEVK